MNEQNCLNGGRTYPYFGKFKDMVVYFVGPGSGYYFGGGKYKPNHFSGDWCEGTFTPMKVSGIIFKETITEIKSHEVKF